MNDQIVPIRLDVLEQIFLKYSPRWPDFRRELIQAGVVRVEDGRGHPEPKPTDVGPTYV